MGECACTPGSNWKAPLRNGLEKIAEDIDDQYLLFISQYTKDPWQLRNAYIDVFLGNIRLENLVTTYIKQTPSAEEIKKIGMILAAQYEKQRMRSLIE